MSVDTSRVSSYYRAEGYKDSAGTLLTQAFDTVNKLQYSASAHKVVYGTVTVTGTATIGMASAGITTLAYFMFSPTVSCLSYFTATASTGSNITITLASGANAATGVCHWMAVND
jgi:hypothetical protein